MRLKEFSSIYILNAKADLSVTSTYQMSKVTWTICRTFFLELWLIFRVIVSQCLLSGIDLKGIQVLGNPNYALEAWTQERILRKNFKAFFSSDIVIRDLHFFCLGFRTSLLYEYHFTWCGLWNIRVFIGNKIIFKTRSNCSILNSVFFRFK